MQLERIVSFNESTNYNKSNNYNQNAKEEKDVSIFNLIDSSTSEQFQDIDIDKILSYEETDLPESLIIKIKEKIESEKTEEDEDDKDILSLSEEEIQNMSTEELIELFRGDLSELIDPENSSLFSNMNNLSQNEILFNLVSKMTDEQLDDFMKTYKEKYPSTNNNGTIDLFSFEALESGVMWGSYAVAAGKISQKELDSVMSKLKEYFPRLVPEASFGAGENGYLQWL